jgi:hypothetical protein
MACASFFIGYRFGTIAPECGGRPSPPLWFQAEFAAAMVGDFFGLSSLTATIALGTAAGAAAGLVFLRSAVRRFLGGAPPQQTTVDLAVMFLAPYALIYAAAGSMGRSCLGLALARSSRYGIQMLPLWTALWLALTAARPRPGVRSLLFPITPAVLLALAACLPLQLQPAAQRTLLYFAQGKASWRDCYLSRGSAADCDRATGFRVHPDPAATRLQDKLDGLARRGAGRYQPRRRER